MLITIEGGEGVGKSTLLAALADELGAVATREPGGSPMSETLRNLLLTQDGLANETELLLFLASRAEHIAKVIQPTLDRGETVVCDRFNDSTIAYQGYARGLGAERVTILCNLISIEPDLTFLIDLDPSIGLQRAASRNRFEDEELAFHEAVREGFLLQAKAHPERIVILDGTLSPEQLFSEALDHVRSHRQ